MKNFKYHLLPLALLLLTLVAACNNNQPTTTATTEVSDTTKIAQSKPNKDSLIIPGISAGAIAIDQDASEVFKVLGKPDSGDAAMQKTVAFWYKGHDPKSTSFAIYTVRDTGDHPIARIKQIRLTSPEYTTEDGLGVSSALSLLRNKFELQKVNLANTSTNKYDLYDSNKGIAFEIAPEGNCTAIIIHSANEPLKVTYLPFH